jgi:hypothetical protein
MRELSRDERDRFVAVQPLLDFDLLAPTRLPRGYALANVEVVPGNRDLVRIELRNPPRGRFVIVERLTVLSLERELELTKDPFTRVRAHGRWWTVIHGQYVGEPVDLWHWHDTRRVISWEQDGVVCEIEEVIRESPSLTMSLRVSASVKTISMAARQSAVPVQGGAS